MKLKTILESSLSRIWQHITNGDTFAVISAFRGMNTDSENLKLHNQLKSDVRGMGLGFIEQKSGYTYSNPDTGEDGTVDEMSLFIPKITLAQSVKLGRKYNQESILFKDNDRFVLIDCKSGSVDLTFKKATSDRPLTFQPDVLKYAFSQLNKGNKNNKIKYAFKTEGYELKIPTRTESYKSIQTGKLSETKWIKIF